MKGKRFSAEQIINVLKEADAGMPAAELCRKYGISEATYYNWKAKYGGMTVNEARRLKDLEQENSRLKKLVADQALEIQMIKEVCSKNFSSPK
ncbi:MAG: transposase [Candidatus Omnitrophica bacterium]|nr:transposase [Candidatus Omnitrophota bacterium]